MKGSMSFVEKNYDLKLDLSVFGGESKGRRVSLAKFLTFIPDFHLKLFIILIASYIL